MHRTVKPLTRKLCESAVCLALAEILGFITFLKLPFDGSITLASMLPVCFLSLRYGVGWGLGSAFCYAVLQMLTGGVFGFGLSPTMLLLSILLDYLLAFTVLGIAGLFRRRGTAGQVLGVALSCTARFLVHFLSGIFLWTQFAEFTFLGATFSGRPVLYSLLYNGSYMLPETVLTVLVAFLLLRLPQVRRLLNEGTPPVEKKKK